MMKSFLHGVKNYIYILWDGYKYNILNMFLKLEKLAGIGLLCLLHWGKICIAIRRSYGEYFMRYIVSFWFVTIFTLAFESMLAEMMVWPTLTNSLEFNAAEIVLLTIGGLFINILIYQFIQGGAMMFSKMEAYRLWMQEAGRANGYVMNVVSVLAIVAALLSKNYADMLNEILLSIAIVSMICSISIDLYMKLVIDDFEKIILEYLRGGYK